MVSAKKESLFYESAFKSMSCFGYLQNNIVWTDGECNHDHKTLSSYYPGHNFAHHKARF